MTPERIAELRAWVRLLYRKNHGQDIADLLALLTAEESRLAATVSHEVAFVRHIESHLTGDQVPVCKICGKDIFQIAGEPRPAPLIPKDRSRVSMTDIVTMVEKGK